MESGVYYLVAGRHIGAAYGEQSHSHILDKIFGRQGQISELLGIYLLRLGDDRDISVVNSRIKQSVKTEYEPCAHLLTLVLGIDEVDLVVSRNILVLRKLRCHIDSRIYEAVIASRRHTLDKYHILVLLDKTGVDRSKILMLYGRQ